MSLSESLRQLREDVRETRAEQRDDLAQFRAEVSARFTALESRVETLKDEHTRGKGWIAGVLAAVSLLVAVAGWVLRLAPLALLAGCAGPAGPFVHARWHETDRPVPVYVDPSVPDACKRGVRFALDTWAVRGVTFFRLTPAAPERGGVWITYNPAIRARHWVGVTYPDVEAGRMHGAQIELATCSEHVIAHELGHAAGLDDLPRARRWRENLMWHDASGGEHVREIELGIIR